MLPPLTLRCERLRDTSIETARAIAARITSEPAASDAKIAMRGIGVDDVAAALVAAVPVCAAFGDVEPAAATTAGFFSFFGFVAVGLRWCFFTGLECVVPPAGCELVVGVDVTGGGVEVTGGGLLVLVGGGGGEDVGGGGGGGGGPVPATAALARASPTATAATPPKIDPMTLVVLNVPLCAGGLPGTPAHAW